MATKTERRRIREVQRLAEKAEPLQEFGEQPRPGRGHKSAKSYPTGMRKTYLVARIARDRPDILERMKAGEFVTVRQAAIAAGIVKDITRIDQFQKLWHSASEEEKRVIAADVNAWQLQQNAKERPNDKEINL